ncbi:hypothetical protein LCM20_09915 [Halobacillus litoralis]|uniref:hypothetical protein n=1 Tax=Halobacillus litoralis TaxID=45668 RepID=UPI001CD1D303|nr:hypothetical protein [Halobacillus litoralis]MCA0970906.1 hypothetical protein [Halobacillus litoralis]
MQTNTAYTYHTLRSDEPELLDQTAACLARSFVGIDVNGQWIQEPMVGLLDLPYDDFFAFTKEYLEATVDQGYCMTALDENGNVVGVMAGDTSAPEIIGEDVFEGDFKDMNVILHVLEDVDQQFIRDFKLKNGRDIEDGEALHFFMLGVTAPDNRKEIIHQLIGQLIEKAEQEELSFIYLEATNKKSIHISEKYHQFEPYHNIDGKPVFHSYKDNDRLNGIPESIAEGTTLLYRKL